MTMQGVSRGVSAELGNFRRHIEDENAEIQSREKLSIHQWP